MPVSTGYMSQSEAAELWGTTERFVRERIARGEIPAYRIGSRIIRLKRSDVEAFARPIPTATSGGTR